MADEPDRLPPWVTWQQRPFPDANLLLLPGRNPTLAGSGFAGHDMGAVRGHRIADRRAAHLSGLGGRCRLRGRAQQRRVLAQDRPLQSLQLAAGLQSQLVA